MNVEINITPSTSFDIPSELEEYYGIHESICNFVQKNIKKSFSDVLGSNILRLDVLKPKRIEAGSSTNFYAGTGNLNFLTIKSLKRITANHIKVIINTPKDSPEISSVTAGRGIQFGYQMLDYPIIECLPRIKIKHMKTMNQTIISFMATMIDSCLLPFNFDEIDTCNCCDETLRLGGGPAMTFSCYVCGKRYICECLRGVLEKLVARKDYAPEPYKTALATTPYRKNTCHLCRKDPSTVEMMPLMYHKGNIIKQYYNGYIRNFEILMDFDTKEAENHVRDKLGVSRIGESWLNETYLLYLVRSLFPNNDVIHQGSPDWLGRQRFDIYIPDFKLAIEYNGEQHYFPVEHFGGEKGFLATQRRDKEKREKVKNAGATLIEFSYGEEMTVQSVSERLKEFLQLSMQS